MPDYSKGMIYKIYNDSIPDKVYYGSSIQPLHKRLYLHKILKQCTSNQLFPGAKIVLVEKFPCSDIMELHKRERWYIENNECVNKNIPYRSEEEKKQIIKDYHIKNKKKVDKLKKNWYNKNKDKVSEKGKLYYKENKDKLNTTSKQWYHKNLEKQKQWREKNKEIHNQKVGCRVCKTMVVLRTFNIHCTTKKHKKNYSS
tara:strand:+ start:118 stop:714 length:597 start_codon:yes stop_codon:yes gene_type:complete